MRRGWFSMHLVTSSQGCQIGGGTRLTYFSSSHSCLPLLPLLPLIPLSCSSLIAFTALLISQIGLIDWIWFLWIEQLYWVAFSLMDRSVWGCVFVRMHVCMLRMIKENFLSPALSFCNPAAISLPGIPAAWSLQTHTQTRIHVQHTHSRPCIETSHWKMFFTLVFFCSLIGGTCWQW